MSTTRDVIPTKCKMHFSPVRTSLTILFCILTLRVRLMVKTQTTRAMMLKASMRATGRHTVYIRAWPLEIQQLVRDPVHAGKKR